MKLIAVIGSMNNGFVGGMVEAKELNPKTASASTKVSLFGCGGKNVVYIREKLTLLEDLEKYTKGMEVSRYPYRLYPESIGVEAAVQHAMQADKARAATNA